MKRAMMFINPKAGMLKGCTTPEQVKAKLHRLKLEPTISIAQSTRGMNTFIAAVKKERPEIVIVAGGDGTTATILKQLRNQPVTFGLIPTGSTNNIGQSIGLGDDLDQAIDVINAGRIGKMDFARVGRTIFIESVGMGLLAQIMERVGEQDTKKEVMRVASHTIATMAVHDDIRVTIKTPEFEVSADTMWLTITNTGRAAAALVDPTSKVDDHVLELVYCEPLRKSELGRYTMAFMRNSHIREPKFHRLQAKEFKLTMAKPVTVHVDGKLTRAQSLTIKVVPAAVSVFMP